MALSSALPSDYVSELATLSYAYHNIMTCRVYRLLKLSQSGTSDGSTLDIGSEDLSTIVFQHGDDVVPAESFPRTENQETFTQLEALRIY